MTEPTNDPYVPPTAELDSGMPEPVRIGWKIYFWVCAILFPLGLGFNFLFGRPQLADFVDLGLSGLSFTGLFGFTFRRHIGSRALWRAVLPVIVVWDLSVIFYLETAGLAYQIPDSEPAGTGEMIFSVAFALPLYVALFRYGRDNPKI